MINNPEKFFEHFLGNSEFLPRLKSLRKSKKGSCLFGNAIRPLSATEIRKLQSNGNRAESWSAIRVTENFNPIFIWNNHFIGPCILGNFDGNPANIGDAFQHPNGLYNSTLSQCEIGHNCLVANTHILSNYILSEQVIVYGCAGLTAAKSCQFGNGIPLIIGPETGEREIIAIAELTLDMAADLVLQRNNTSLQEAYRQLVESYIDALTLPFGFIESNATLCSCGSIENAYIGPNSTIDNIQKITNTTIQSNSEEPTQVGAGVIVNDSLIQWGCKVNSSAILKNALLLEHSHAEQHGKVNHTIIGPNSGIAKGEATSSFIGPFVGFHHQALLIAALWPEGKGNIGYGANVGSNHTGKAPDQEIFCGEGTFFGLGVNIIYPANFLQSPYSIIATDVTTLPQKISFPFSLINTPSQSIQDIPPVFNEIIPGWMLSENSYSLFRNQFKFETRNLAKRTHITFEIFRPEIIDMLLDARIRLLDLSLIKDYYTEQDIRGLGKNFMTEPSRKQAVIFYSRFIQYYALRGLYQALSELAKKKDRAAIFNIYREASKDTLWEHQRNILISERLDQIQMKDNLMKLVEIQTLIADSVSRAKERDDRRGPVIIADYADVHLPASEDPVVRRVQQDTWDLAEKVEKLINDLK